LQSGLALNGVKTNVIESNKKQETRNKPEEDIINKDEQIVEMHVTSAGFEPATLKIKKGVPVKWVVKGDQVTSCTSTIIIPSLNISKRINSGDNIIRFTSDKAGTIPYSCGMGMVRGKFVVE
jgi:plastocyanin domain-containing protein